MADVNSTDRPDVDQLDNLKAKIQSANQSSPQLNEDINQFVGLYLKQNDDGSRNPKDYQEALVESLGEQHRAQIRQVLESDDKKMGQYCADGSELNKDIKADPIMMFNGQYLHTSQDLTVKGAGIDFVFTRIYKNQVFYNGPLGFNWDHNYNLWLREEGNTLVRSSGELREDRYIKHEQYNYYVPPAGYHDVLEPAGNSFALRTPTGVHFIYERVDQTHLHRIQIIKDRNGNYLSFGYDIEGRLQGVEVNEKDRQVTFAYDTLNRIVAVAAYPVTYRKQNGLQKVRRVWRYTYDDFGDLVAVTSPGTDRYPAGLTTRYEYSSASHPGELSHNLLRIIDPAGQLYLENEFGTQRGVLSYNRVVRQRQGNGEYQLEYEDIIREQSWDYAPEEVPAHRTIFYQRNGHAVEHIYNSLGNLIVKREQVLDGCGLRALVSRYRYNQDGALIGSLSPEGSVVQYYYGREEFYNRPVKPGSSQLEPWQDPNLTKTERLRFGNLLGVVKRGKYYTLSQMNLARGVYGDFFPSVFAKDPEDVIVKYTYEPDYQQVASLSDPRHTISVDPRHSEVANPASPYNRHLTIYEYSALPKKNLVRIKYPDITFPSPLRNGTTGMTNMTEEYLQYDAKGRVKRVKDPEGNITKYEYFNGALAGKAKDGYLHKEVRGANILDLTTTYEVNEAGAVTATTNPRNIRTEFTVNELDQSIETLTGGPGFRTKVFFNRNGLLERRERDNLDGAGQPSPDGSEISTFYYDAQNNLIEETIGGANLAQHHITRHFYNSSDKRIKTVLPRGNNLHYEYDERLFLRAVIRGDYCSLSSTIKTFYDGDGRRIAVVDGRGNITHFKYDAFGRLISTRDALENIRQNEYDKLNNVSAERFFERRSNGNYYLLSRRTYEYDERGNKIREISYLFTEPILTADVEKAPDQEFTVARNQGLVTPVETQYFYDKKKRLFRALNGKDQATTYTYDRVDRRIMERDSAGNYSRTTYDENSNVVRVDHYEAVRHPKTGAVLRQEVFSIVHEYDDLDRKVATIDGLGNRTTFTYDSRNNLVVIKDALGNIKRYEYDIFNRKTQEIAEMTGTGLGGSPQLADIITQFTYDKNGNLISVKDARNVETRFEFDPLDRMVRTMYTDGSYTCLEYDADDNVVASTDNNGLKVLYTLDSLSRKTYVSLDKTGLLPGQSYPTGVEESEAYQYDGLGRAVQQKNDFCEINSKFDSFGRAYEERLRLTTPSSPAGNFVLKRTFDVLSNRTVLVYPSGRRIRYSYDRLNRVKTIRNISKGNGYPGSQAFPKQYEIAQYEYRGRRLGKVRYGNRTEYELFYDGLGRIISLKHTSTTKRLLEIQQLYDGAGNRRFQRDNPARAGSPGGEVYKYDSLYRLTKFERKSLKAINPAQYDPPNTPRPLVALVGQQAINTAIGSLAQNPVDYTYKYDALGNRQEERRPGQAAVTYQTNSLNQYQTKGTISFQYDLNGNLLDDRTRRYLYNYKNQLVRVRDKATNTDLLALAYDAAGRLIAIQEGANIIYLINDGLNVIEEYKGGNVISQYVYENGIDQRCQMVNGSEEWWYHSDLIQSTRLLSNSNGQVPANARYRYEPFGALVKSTSQYNPYLFAGKRLFKSIDLYDSRVRHYSTILGRFLQRDPKGMVDGPNLYTYTGNNPVKFVDPLGSEKTEPATSTNQGESTEPFSWEAYYGGPEEWRMNHLLGEFGTLTEGAKMHSYWMHMYHNREAESLMISSGEAFEHRLKAFGYLALNLGVTPAYIVDHFAMTVLSPVGWASSKIQEKAPGVLETIAYNFVGPDPADAALLAASQWRLQAALLADRAALQASALARATLWRGVPRGSTAAGDYVEAWNALRRYSPNRWIYTETIKSNYKTFDFIRAGESVSLKKLDLTSKSYQNSPKLFSLLNHYIDEAANASVSGKRILDIQYVGQFPTSAQRYAFNRAYKLVDELNLQKSLGLELEIGPFLRGF